MSNISNYESCQTTLKRIEVMQAYADGKIIEGKQNGKNNWTICDYPSWNWQSCEFRIKKEPKYIPFEWEDRDLLINKWVKNKNLDRMFLVTGIYVDHCYINGIITEWKDLLKYFEFLDGSPCGKLEE